MRESTTAPGWTPSRAGRARVTPAPVAIDERPCRRRCRTCRDRRTYRRRGPRGPYRPQHSFGHPAVAGRRRPGRGRRRATVVVVRVVVFTTSWGMGQLDRVVLGDRAPRWRPVSATPPAPHRNMGAAPGRDVVSAPPHGDQHGDRPTSPGRSARSRRPRRAPARRRGRTASARGAAVRRPARHGRGRVAVVGTAPILAAGWAASTAQQSGFAAPSDRRRPVTTRRPRAWICSSTRASSTSPATASRSARAASPTTVDEAVAQAEAAGYPVVVKAQVQVGGRGQGGRHQARQRRRRGAHPRREHPRHGHQGPHRRAGLGRARLRHRRGVLRQLHARPGRQAAPADAVGPGRRRDRGGRRQGPRRHRQAAHRPGRRALARRRPPGRRRRQDPRPGARRRGRHPRAALRVLRRRATATWPRSTR